MARIDEKQVASLRAAQDAEAAAFWAYPSEGWQRDFQASWLLENCGVNAAICPDGFIWGAE